MFQIGKKEYIEECTESYDRNNLYPGQTDEIGNTLWNLGDWGKDGQRNPM